MKRIISSIVLLSVCIVAIAEKPHEDYPARFSAKIVDEDGNPLAGMNVEGGFYGQVPLLKGVTDSNGLFVIETENAMAGEGGFSVNHKIAGYYESHSGCGLSKIENGRWEPWNPIVTAVVRRVMHPVPMYAKHVETKIQATNLFFGFDLKTGNWMSPREQGSVSDLVYRVDGYWNNYRDNDAVLTLSFSRPGDGIRADTFKATDSQFKMAREAPNEGYLNSIQWRKSRAMKEGLGNDFKVNELKEAPGYIFRIRSETNKNGIVTNACYGKIPPGIEFGGAGKEGCYLKFTYYLNPTPNDRNLEFDPAENLLTNLKPFEQVREP